MKPKFAPNEPTWVRQHYRESDNFNVRVQTHEKYSQPKSDFIAWILDRTLWSGDEVVVDVGCGSGAYIAETRRRSRLTIAGDISFGMLESLSFHGLDRINMDAQRLPLRIAAADVLLANHMIYHVPDINMALAEFVRALRPNGRLLAATNSQDNMSELKQMMVTVAGELGFASVLTESYTNFVYPFTLENGASILAPYFNRVERHVLDGALVFPSPGPVIDYVSSASDHYERFLPPGVTWDDVITVMGRYLSSHIVTHGEFRVNKCAGVFVCSQ